ncbi:23S rRNA (pseudouridine(1915)-N(3))-methyltransferase RlmH [Aestuariivirga sp.]|uniref:23S rRNA (pseudouridine(1915)-N(3))-methyltransferase RlmH n=1 Tax=Aestuariivirga sp. TaxID=2650926 RepID=UPI0037848493
MRLAIIAAGRLKPGPEKSLAEDYLTRAQGLGRGLGISKITVTDFNESQAATATARMTDEARLIASALPPRSFRVVLDERGKALASQAFADVLRRQLNDGTGDMAFLIGGPDGHAAELREAADLTLSFGPMTWPHRLVRVMLLEQLYRAITILAGHPYHRA